jgi:hypothetical protein
LEQRGFVGILPEEETLILDFVSACPVYSLDDEVIVQAIRLRQQMKMKLGDAIIAAIAVASGGMTPPATTPLPGTCKASPGMLVSLNVYDP